MWSWRWCGWVRVGAAIASACGAGVAGAETVRFATFNVAMNRATAGGLGDDLASGDDAQIAAVAEIIQRVNPDVILLNEFDYDTPEEGRRRVELFQANYLGVSHHGSAPVRFGHVYVDRSNTGVPSGHDLDGNGRIGGEAGSRDYGGDCLGYGVFEGQYNMVLLSKYPVATGSVRTFREFLWRDMPGAALPDDPETPAPADFYTDEELSVIRLSSKNHWDIPVRIDGVTVHVLCSHPTPPVFDGPEDRNGRRNHDEIRLWADYITPGKGDYLVDDEGEGVLAEGAAFVILGDMNADPNDGGTYQNAIRQLLDSPRVNTSVTPTGAGGTAASARQGGVNASHKGDPAADTADFADLPAGRAGGNMRVDYALPSIGLAVRGSGVFWPAPGEAHFGLVGVGDPVVSSDHRLVWVDVSIEEAQVFGTGDVFTIPLGDGTFGFGQVLSLEHDALDSVAIAVFASRSPMAEMPESLSSVLAVQLTSRDLLDRGTWKVVGAGAPLVEDRLVALRAKRFVGATIVGSANIREFCEAVHGLRPWDSKFDPEYFDKLLISPDAKPTTVVYERERD